MRCDCTYLHLMQQMAQLVTLDGQCKHVSNTLSMAELTVQLNTLIHTYSPSTGKTYKKSDCDHSHRGFLEPVGMMEFWVFIEQDYHDDTCTSEKANSDMEPKPEARKVQ